MKIKNNNNKWRIISDKMLKVASITFLQKEIDLRGFNITLSHCNELLMTVLKNILRKLCKKKTNLSYAT